MSEHRVPVEPFRERYLKLVALGDITAHDLADILGWTRIPAPSSRSRRSCIPDTSRVTYTLGLAPASKGSGRGRGIRRTVRYETALALAEALGLDPFEVGL